MCFTCESFSFFGEQTGDMSADIMKYTKVKCSVIFPILCSLCGVKLHFHKELEAAEADFKMQYMSPTPSFMCFDCVHVGMQLGRKTNQMSLTFSLSFLVSAQMTAQTRWVKTCINKLSDWHI